MVKQVVACLAGVMVSVALGCKSEPSKVGAPVSGAAGVSPGLNGRFHYQVVDGVPVVLWTAPDGKHVSAMRVDARWACDVSTGKLVCGPKEPATPACAICPASQSCSCVDPECSHSCGESLQQLPGLHDAAQPSR